MAKIIPPIQVTEPTPQDRRIAWWMENTLVRFVIRVLNRVSTTFRNIISFSILDLFEELETELVDYVSPLFNEILAMPEVPEYIKHPMRKALASQNPIALAILGLITPVIYTIINAGIAGPIGRLIETRVETVLRTARLDPSIVLEMRRRGIIGQPEFRAAFNQLGYTQAKQDWIANLVSNTFDENLLTQALWRGSMSSDAISQELQKIGYTQPQIDVWMQSRQVIPAPSELITMAVREAFNDQIAAQFGYDEGFPTEAADWAAKQGMDRVWFQRAWRAHWALPGLTQVREMRHRDIIDDTAVENFLVAADIPSFWRSAIKKWMFREVTRVDLRRMYALGVIDATEVYTRYLKIGYTDDDAQKLTEWTVKAYHDTERQLTKTDILNMYESGILDSSETSAFLGALDFNSQDVSLLMVHRDLKRQEKWESQIIDNTKNLFVKGVYDRTDVFSELGKLDTPGTFIEQTLQVWDLLKKAEIAIPSITQLRDMAQDGIISVQTFRDELVSKGYPDKYINWYVALWLS